MLKVSVAVVVVMAMLGLTSWGRIGHENASRIMLPNSKLLGCRSSACFSYGKTVREGRRYISQASDHRHFGNDTYPRGYWRSTKNLYPWTT